MSAAFNGTLVRRIYRLRVVIYTYESCADKDYLRQANERVQWPYGRTT